MKIRITIIPSLVLSLFMLGCTMVSQNRVFPKLVWYWSDEAKAQRAAHNQEEEQARTNHAGVYQNFKAYQTNVVLKPQP
jgi:hypothetical protein